MSYQIVITRNGEQFGKPVNLIDGDQFVFETPSHRIFGRNAVIKWKLKNAERQNKNLRDTLAREREQVDLTFIPTDRLLAEISSRIIRDTAA